MMNASISNNFKNMLYGDIKKQLICIFDKGPHVSIKELLVELAAVIRSI